MRILLCALVVLVATGLGHSQMMSKTEYRDHLKLADETALRWEKQLNSIDVDKLKVSYSAGRSIDKARSVIIRNFRYMHGFIVQLLISETLNGDISIENTLGDVVSPLDSLIDLLPNTSEGLYWVRTLGPMSGEMMNLQLPLRRHIDTMADTLQLKADLCSR